MGGYAVYVWGSFGVAVAALGIEAILLRARRRRALAAVALQQGLTS